MTESVKKNFFEKFTKEIVECDEMIAGIKENMDISIMGNEYHLNFIKMYQVRKLLFNTIINRNNGANKDIFPKILSKYDELILNTLEYVNDLVQSNKVEEGDYLKLCSVCSVSRKNMEHNCKLGETIVGLYN